MSVARRVLVCPGLLGACLLALCMAPAPASAAGEGTGWAVSPSVYPTYLVPGGQGDVQIDFEDVGAVSSSGAITVTDTLPLGVSATRAGGMEQASAHVFSHKEEEEVKGAGLARWSCTGNGSGEGDVTGATVVSCQSNPAVLERIPGPLENELVERVGIDVQVGAAASSGTNHVTVEGGGATRATSTSDPVTVSSSQPGFGFSGWDVLFSNADGSVDTQAGSHPYEMIVSLGLNELAGEVNGSRLADGEVRNLEVDLPPGLFGDPAAVPRCTRAQLDGQHCPADTQVGIDWAGTYEESGGGNNGDAADAGVYDMVPPRGVPAQFAFSVAGFHAFLNAGVRNGNGYGLVEHVENAPPVIKLEKNILMLWGVPAEASHNAQRASNGVCEEECASGVSPEPLLTLPTSCQGPQTFTVRGLATWTDPNAHAEASVQTHTEEQAPAGFTGCELLSMQPFFAIAPETNAADSATGLTAQLRIPQETLEVPHGLVAATLKNTRITLPAGLVVNPGRAQGLAACGEAEAKLHEEAVSTCPTASRIGTLQIKTPLLEGDEQSELHGEVYVLQSNPPNLRLLLAPSADGLNLKLVANVHLDEATGQITTTVGEGPELPFSELTISFEGAAATPTQCATYTTSTDFTPWTTPVGEDLFPTSSFQINSSCPSSPPPFAPSLVAGSTSDQAGAFTSFSLLLARADRQQRIGALQVKLPLGLGAQLGRVPLCPEPQASEGSCGEASQIGRAVVSAGPGSNPLVLPQSGAQPIRVYLTGPYNGEGPCTVGSPGCAPFGLSIVAEVLAGPFNLGRNVVRAKVEVDPSTAQVTVTTNTSGAHAIPQILDGVPTDVRSIDTVVEDADFLFNPTNCNAQASSATVAGAQGASAQLESRFQVGGCQALGFHPSFSASTQGNGSPRGNGASLVVRVAADQGPSANPAAVGEANIAKVDVSLPLALPSRLTTLQKACTEAQFAADPAGCPAASDVGTVVAHTPELPVALTGPAYLVSHGGAAFPDLEIILQGYGVTIVLDGKTQIKKGITYSRFETIPDAPVTSFELKLPEGPYSVLAANTNLCKPTKTVTVTKSVARRVHGRLEHVRAKVEQTVSEALAMPTTITGQNGAVLAQTTKIAVTGCPRAKAASKADKARKASGARRRARH
jgi:hypothetical protein